MIARNKHHAKLFQRYEHNPILTANDWPFGAALELDTTLAAQPWAFHRMV